MFATALIVFREVLEASLIVTLIMATTRGIKHRGLWVSGGIMGGVVGAGIVAACTSALAGLFNGSGQDIVNACTLFIAVALISWHTIWMNSHGREIAARMKRVGKSVSDGEKHLSILAVVVGLAIMREGSEVVLMLQGLWSSGDAATMIGGATLGLTAGVAVATLMYLGFLVLPLQKVFSVTNVILVMIAAGMAARGANFLAQADLIPSWGARLWDSSAVISDQSVPGQLLSALIGYIARPSGVEVAFYAATIIVVTAMMRLIPRAR